MSPRVIIVAVVLAIIAGTYYLGYTHGAQNVQQAWNNETIQREQQLRALQEEGNKIAEVHEREAARLRRELAKRKSNLQNSLQSKVECPSSEQLGDIVVPADVVDGLFERARAFDDAPASSKPNR